MYTVCMLFCPIERYKIVCNNFSQFCLAGHILSFVPVVKYLGHIIDNEMQDDGDVLRELKCLFTRTNILICRFARCSVDVKIRLFRSYCLSFFDIAVFKTLESAYVKCLKIFFNYQKFASVTGILLEIGLPSFHTLRHNAEWSFSRRVSALLQTVDKFCGTFTLYVVTSQFFSVVCVLVMVLCFFYGPSCLK